jgi:hypothetical protein
LRHRPCVLRGTRPPDAASIYFPWQHRAASNRRAIKVIQSRCLPPASKTLLIKPLGGSSDIAHYRFLAPVLRRIISCSQLAALNYDSTSNSVCLPRCLSSQENTLLHPPQLSVHEVSVACSFTPESRSWKHQVTTTVTINESQCKYFGAQGIDRSCEHVVASTTRQ